MKKIFVPLDGSNRSETVLPLVIALARNNQHSVTLFSVRDSGAGQPSGVSEDDSQDPDVSGLEFLRDDLATVAEAVAREGIEVTTEVRSGYPTGALLAAIRELDPDLIAMSSRGRGGVTDRVIAAAKAPVLVLSPLRLEFWPPDELQSDDALPAIYDDLGLHCRCPVAADIARAVGAHGALLSADYEVLREMVEGLMSLTKASSSGNQCQDSLKGDPG
jgi:nucleotide-binding universal stress UspA family protein